MLLLQVWCSVKCASITWEVLRIHQLPGQVCTRPCHETPSRQGHGGRAPTYPLPKQSSSWANCA